MSNENTNSGEQSVTGLQFEDDIPTPTDVSQPSPTAVLTETTNALHKAAGIAPADNEGAEAGVATEDAEQAPIDADERTEAQEQAEIVAVLMRTGVNKNAEMYSDPTAPLNPKTLWREGESLFVLPCTSDEFSSLVINTKRLDPTQSAQGANWRDAVTMGRQVMPRANNGLDALLREGSLWRQSVRVGDEGSTEIAAGRPKPGDRRGNAPLVGEEALQYMQTMLGAGQLIRFPLWHSGLWLNMKAPTESQLLELDRRIANEKINLGRHTNGLAYSNMSVYHNSFLFNFALSMVFDCSISGYTTEVLKRKIKITDMPQLLWGLLCTIYPNGYRYHRPCVLDPASCTHVVEALLDIAKLSWTDNAALTQAQRNHMVRKTAKFTDIELSNYESQHAYSAKNTVVLKDINGNKTVVELRVPTLADYEQSGFSWVEGIVASTDQAFGSQLGGEERNEYILDQARATALRQYAHWIERISFNDGQQSIEDRATLETLIGQLTGQQDVFDKFMEGVRKFINEATISQIAIPSYKCPACQADQNNPEEAKHPHLIPLDIGTVFFILLGQRTTLLLEGAVI